MAVLVSQLNARLPLVSRTSLRDRQPPIDVQLFYAIGLTLWRKSVYAS